MPRVLHPHAYMHAGSPPHFTMERVPEKIHLTDINRISYDISTTWVIGAYFFPCHILTIHYYTYSVRACVHVALYNVIHSYLQ